MKLIVKNFGPIKDASIDVKPLTVFTGPANRGKSYLATLLHTVIQNRHRPMMYRYYEVSTKLYGTLKKGNDAISDKQFISLVEDSLKTHCQDLSRDWRENMNYYFGEISESLLKNKPDINITSDDDNTIIDLMTSTRSCFHQDIRDVLLKNLKKSKQDEISPEDFSFHETFYTTERTIRRSIGFPYDIQGNMEYLPAVRSGIMQSHRLMVSLLIKRATFAGIREQQAIPSFHGIFADFLNRVNSIDKRRLRFSQDKRRKDIVQLADNVETQLLEGKVNVIPSPTGTPDFFYQFTQANEKHEIPLMHSASTVSELSPFVLFLRYYLRKGDFLIFEEPEAHLHPQAQQHLTALLIHLIQQGVNVLITTHSSVILEQLGNCVFAHRFIKKYGKKNPDKVEQLREKYPIALSAPLHEKDVAAYDFDRPTKNGRGTIVKHIPYDLNTDYLPEHHYDVSNELIKEGSTLQTIYDDESLDP
ncbi:MAG: AAA family ATPase [Alphaproteobacteria bacterium GM202ARS2]|nr:AAA family ATPase [Alphaproteobacteria bacterium GM202ARS2]